MSSEENWARLQALKAADKEARKLNRRNYDNAYRKRRRQEDAAFRLQRYEIQKRWASKNPEFRQAYTTSEHGKRKHKSAKLKNKFGISLDQFESLFEAQGKTCKACGSSEHYGRGWHTDHCHETGAVRGILCHPCNTSLGQFKENPERIRRLAVYAERCITLRGNS